MNPDRLRFTCSARHCRHPSRGSIADGLQAFKLHVSAVQRPLVVLLEHHGADQPCDGCAVEEDAHDVCSPLDLGVEPLQRVGAVDLGPVRTWEGHDGEHIVFGLVHASGQLKLLAELVDHGPPLRLGRLWRVLHEDRADGGRDHALLRLVGTGQRVAHEVHAAALPGGLEQLEGSGLDAFVHVADDELHAAQPAPVQAEKELPPEGLGFAGADLHAQILPLALGVHAHRHYDGHAHDSPGLARLES